MTTEISLIRHGTPEGGNLYRGNTIDDPLSDKGWQQMRDAVAGITPWDIVISSPMQRCLAFAEDYADQRQLKVIVEDNLKEIGFGVWEGFSSKQILDKDPQAIKNFYRDPVKFKPENAEPVAVFQQRVSKALQQILTQQQDKRVLVVAHAGVIRAAITATIKAPPEAMYKISVGNAAIITIRDDGIRPPTLICT
jgi:broad specificity phosphatase PhoE